MFSLPVGTEMFHFPTFPPDALCVQAQVPGLSSRWVSPFGHPRITGRLSPSRGFSQTPTSFIGSRCQGIHHVHLVACCCYKMLASTVKFSRYVRSHTRSDAYPLYTSGSSGCAVQGSSRSLIPQDPTVRQAKLRPHVEVPFSRKRCTDDDRSTTGQIVDVH